MSKTVDLIPYTPVASTELSIKPEIRTLLQLAPQKDSWLEQLHNVFKQYLKVDEYLKELKKAVETGWIGKKYTSSWTVIKNDLYTFPPSFSLAQKSFGKILRRYFSDHPGL